MFSSSEKTTIASYYPCFMHACHFHYPLDVQEMDFVLEGKNAELCVANFAKMSPHLASKIAVPKIYWELSTSRLMAMEFMQGVGVTDVAAMERLGIHPFEVARLVSTHIATYLKY